MDINKRPSLCIFLILIVIIILSGCSNTYYAAMEKAGVHKRDILVDRVEGARDSQTDAQQQFKSALEQFGEVVQLKNTDLKQAYDKLHSEYELCEKAAQKVSDRVDKVESVADALFDEWQDELDLYESITLRNSSKKQLRETKANYKELLISMHTAEKSMKPVLESFRDNVLFLKHNLNAQAIGSLHGEFSTLKSDINGLVKKMNTAIADSDAFIAKMSM